MRAFSVITLIRATLTDPTLATDIGRLLGSQLSAVRWAPRIVNVDVAGVHATREDGARLHVVYRCYLSVAGVASSDEASRVAFEALADHVPGLRWPASLGVANVEVLSALTAGIER